MNLIARPARRRPEVFSPDRYSHAERMRRRGMEGIESTYWVATFSRYWWWSLCAVVGGGAGFILVVLASR